MQNDRILVIPSTSLVLGTYVSFCITNVAFLGVRGQLDGGLQKKLEGMIKFKEA
jgi:hypothetical protein